MFVRTTAFAPFMSVCLLLICYMKYIHRHTCQPYGSKNHHRYNVGAPPFCPTPSQHVREAPGQRVPSSTTGHLQTLILSRQLLKPLHCCMNPLELVQVHHSVKESAPNMVLWRVHMEPISMWQHDISSKLLLCFITYHGTIPKPTS